MEGKVLIYLAMGASFVCSYYVAADVHGKRPHSHSYQQDNDDVNLPEWKDHVVPPSKEGEYDSSSIKKTPMGAANPVTTVKGDADEDSDGLFFSSMFPRNGDRKRLEIQILRMNRMPEIEHHRYKELASIYNGSPDVSSFARSHASNPSVAHGRTEPENISETEKENDSRINDGKFALATKKDLEGLKAKNEERMKGVAEAIKEIREIVENISKKEENLAREIESVVKREGKKASDSPAESVKTRNLLDYNLVEVKSARKNERKGRK